MTSSLSIYSWITVGLWSVLVLFIALGAKTANADIDQQQKASLVSRILKILGMMYFFALVYFPRTVGISTHPSAAYLGHGLAGAAVCAAGVLLVIASRRMLGRNWSDLVVVKRDHELIRSGPYRWVRHPLYSGLLLAILGSAMTVNTRVAYITVPFVMLGLWMKSRREEMLLEKHFPQYSSYRRKVKAFIPFVL